jgi:hypothetical protein
MNGGNKTQDASKSPIGSSGTRTHHRPIEAFLFSRSFVSRFARVRTIVVQWIASRLRQAPRVQALSSRSRWCAPKHPDGYRDTVYRRRLA